MFSVVPAVPSGVSDCKFSMHVRPTESLTKIVLATFCVRSNEPSWLTSCSSFGPLLDTFSPFAFVTESSTSGGAGIERRTSVGCPKTYHKLIAALPSLFSRVPRYTHPYYCSVHSLYWQGPSLTCANDSGRAMFENQGQNQNGLLTLLLGLASASNESKSTTSHSRMHVPAGSP